MQKTIIGILDLTLSVEYPGHTIDTAYTEALNRMQKAYEHQQHLEEELKRIRYQLDHIQQDFYMAEKAALLFYDEIENQTQTRD